MIDNSKSALRRWDAIKNRMSADEPIFGVEVGVWKGQMSKKLLGIMPNLNLVLVDWWKAPPPGHSYFDGSLKISRMSDAELEAAFQIAMENIRPFGDRVSVARGESAETASIMPDKYFDIVFIDGDHSYEGVMRDLEAWVPKVKSGGWIGGHDYAHEQQGDVKGAVTNFFTKKQLENLELDGNRTWFLRL